MKVSRKYSNSSIEHVGKYMYHFVLTFTPFLRAVIMGFEWLSDEAFEYVPEHWSF